MRLKHRLAFLLGNALGFFFGLYDQLVRWLYNANGWRDWKCVGYKITGNGGQASGTFTLKRMTLQKAQAYIAEHHGTVVSVASHESLIFYKSKE